MCVIIHKPKGVVLPEKYIKEGHRVNRHGFGLMYYDEEQSKIIVKKQAEYDIEDVCKQLENLKDKEVALHFRISTHGSVKDDNCHPFPVLSKKQNAMEMWMMHNGTIHDAKSNIEGDETDSNAWIRTVALPILKIKPGLIRVPEFQNLLKETISGSRLVFMFGAGEVAIINKRIGHERDNCWFSNTSAFPTWTSTCYTGLTHNKNTNKRSYLKDKEDTDTDKNTILGVSCKVGEKVFLWNQKDNSYVGQGVITHVGQYYSHIEVVIDNEVVKVTITNKTGESSYNGTASVKNRWYALPQSCCEERDYAKKTIGDVLSHSEEKEGHTCNVTRLEDKPNPKEDVELSHEELEKLQKEIDSYEDKEDANENQKKDWTGGQEITSMTNQNNEQYIVSCSNPFKEKETLSVDAFEHLIGADSLESVYQNYDEISIADIYHMSIEERFELYVEYPNVGFAIFNDMLDHFCLHGAEYTEEDHDEYMELMAGSDEEDDDDDEGNGNTGGSSESNLLTVSKNFNSTLKQHTLLSASVH